METLLIFSSALPPGKVCALELDFLPGAQKGEHLFDGSAHRGHTWAICFFPKNILKVRPHITHTAEAKGIS